MNKFVFNTKKKEESSTLPRNFLAIEKRFKFFFIHLNNLDFLVCGKFLCWKWNYCENGKYSYRLWQNIWLNEVVVFLNCSLGMHLVLLYYGKWGKESETILHYKGKWLNGLIRYFESDWVKFIYGIIMCKIHSKQE